MQKGDIIHTFGRPYASYVSLAHSKGFKVVVADLLGGVGARPNWGLALQRVLFRYARSRAPKIFLYCLGWDAYESADAIIALTGWEANLMHSLYGAPKDRLHVVPNGVDEVFFNTPPTERSQWLVCTATITPVKRILELAEAAVLAKTPLWIIGKPYSEKDPYGQVFLEFAANNSQYIRYEGPIADRQALARAYRQAKGFVLLSQWESLSLSALEAAACGCPLLLSDLPWAHSVFAENASYCPVKGSAQVTARVLKNFYEQAPKLPVPPRPSSWGDVGQQLKSVYESVLSKT
jgi:glycosyltransferase involved in cell wall biosynthesis